MRISQKNWEYQGETGPLCLKSTYLEMSKLFDISGISFRVHRKTDESKSSDGLNKKS